MSDSVVQIMPITDFDEDMLIPIDRNFKELARMLGILQVYMTKEGKPTLSAHSDFAANSIMHGLKADIPDLG